jgi:hypothetical protein
MKMEEKMKSTKNHNMDSVENYVRCVSNTSGLNLSEERLKPHFPEFRRLLNDVEVLNDLVTSRSFIHVGPVTIYTHIKGSLDSRHG